MNNQQAFTTAIRGVLMQGRKSTETNTCLYRGPNNLRCGVGHLIPDNLFSDKIEGLNISSMLRANYMYDEELIAVKSRLRQHFKDVSPELLDDIQRWHDRLPENFDEHIDHINTEISYIAFNYNLQIEEGCQL